MRDQEPEYAMGLKGVHLLSEQRRSINIIGDKRSIHW